MELKYHALTFRHLLRKTPSVSLSAPAHLERLEKAHDFVLPASVKEWYSLEYAVDILRKYDPYSDHHWLSVEDTGASTTGLGQLKFFKADDQHASAQQYGAQALLVFCIDWEACGSNAIALDGTDDRSSWSSMTKTRQTGKSTILIIRISANG
jgi:hypothetical protein